MVFLIATIGEQIKALRKRKGITQQQLAETLNLKRSTIANYEINRRAVGLEELIAIADYFGVGLDYFGINENKNEIFDLLSRAHIIFKSKEITKEEKEMLHYELLKLYMQLKEENTTKGK